MERYKNLSGDSGVVAYEIRDNGIIVEFVSGECYLYDERIPGTRTVEQMKALAQKGKGLSTYISRHVRKNYAAVW
jgi:hypothetical protein